VGDEAFRADSSQLFPGEAQTTGFMPTAVPAGMQAADLAGADLYLAAVEAAAQAEVGRFIPIPGADEQTAVFPRDFNCLIQRRRVAGQLEGKVGASG